MTRHEDQPGSASTVQVAPDELRAAVASRPALAPGTVLDGRYRIDRFVARGGMGAVYAAHDLELDLAIAVKTIRPDLAWSEGVIERFKREIQLARAVTHPAVCRIFDLGRHGEGEATLVFLTMELLAGETLAERIARGALPEAEARPVIEQLVSGLAAAHAAGVVHRDLKPGNVLLVPRAGAVRTVITDFGLAREVEAAAAAIGGAVGADEPAGTTVVGTPDYMAPEQLRGEVVGPAADVFALGVVVHEVLTGRLPHAGATTIEAAQARAAAAPARPELADLPPRWAPVVERCLAARAEDRYPSAREVAAALAPPRGGRRGLIALAAVVALAAAAIAALVWWPRAATAVDPTRPRGAAAERAYREGVAALRDGDETTAAARLREAIAAEPDFPLAHAELASALRALGDPAGARAAATRAAARSGALDREHALVVEARLDEVHQRWPRAVERYQELRRLAPGEPEYLMRLAYAQLSTGTLREAAASIAELRGLGVDHPRVDYLEAYLASRHGDWPALRAATRRVVASADRIGARRMAALAWTEQGNALMNLGDEDGARAALAEAERRFVANGDPSGRARVIYVRAQLTGQRDRAAASAELRRGLELYRGAGNVDGEAMTLSALAMFAPADRLDEAIGWYEQSLAAYRAAGDTANRDNTIFNLATLHFKKGDHAAWRAMTEEVLAGARVGGVPITVAIAAVNLAAVTLQEADPPRAQVLIDEAAAAARGVADPTIDAYVRWIRGEIAQARADDAAAARDLAAAVELAATSGDPAPVEQARCSLARVDPGGDVVAACTTASATLEAVGLVDEAVTTAWYAARGHLGRGQRAPARALLPRLAALAQGSQDVHTALTARLAAAELAGAAGDEGALAAVAQEAQAIGARALGYEARFARGLALAAGGKRGEADEVLAALEAEAEARSMTAIARRCRAARRR